MKKVFIALSSAAVLINLSAFASIPSKSLLLKRGVTGAGILTLNTTTPNNQEIFLDELKDYSGVSTSAPCSDLTLNFDDRAENGYTITTEPGSLTASSQDILDSVGPNVTCIKEDIYYHHKLYSTGNIQLTWDGKEYTAANPNVVNMNFTN